MLTKLGGAVERVIDAGNTLRWAKATLPHGEYLPWVQQACGLDPRHAQKLMQAAEWANTAHVPHLDQITDATTLVKAAEWTSNAQHAAGLDQITDTATLIKAAEWMSNVQHVGHLDGITDTATLVKAAEWVNAAHVRHLDQITDATTLFLLSADATPDDVREWVMERCAAGNPPTRTERKTGSSTSGEQ